jgi:DNA-binding XRE family transcriptional regulator
VKSILERQCSELQDLRKVLGYSLENLARSLGVSYQTVYRWEKKKVRPSPLAREKFENLRLLVEKMKELEKDPSAWFDSPNPDLGGKTPREIAKTPNGIQQLLNLLTRAEWGIPS